jgi:hypothetical protein
VGKHVVLCHVTAVRLGRVGQVDLDAQRVPAVHRPVVVDPVRQRRLEMLHRARVGDSGYRDSER